MATRLATAADIPRLIEIRAAVRENRLGDRVIGPSDYAPYLVAACCWVWEQAGDVRGFSAIEPGGESLWALFVLPGAEGRGIGRALLDVAVAAARTRGAAALALTTEPGSRAEAVYARYGFARAAMESDGSALMRLSLR